MSKRSLQSIKIFAGIVATLSIVVSTLLLMPLRVQASPDDTSIMKKTLANAISKCYSSTYIHQDITPAGHFSMEDDMFVYANRKKGDILVLDDLGGKMSCEQVFLGSNKAQGLNSLFGKNPSSPASLGYVQAPGDNPSSTRCMSISYKHPGSSGNVEQFTSNSLCFGVLSDGTIDKNSFPEGSEFASDCDQPVCLAADALGRVYIVWEDNYGMHYDMEVAYYGNAMNNSSATSWDDLYNTVSGEASKLGSEYGYTNPSMSQTKTDDPGAFASYTINNYGDAAKTAFQYYTGSSNMDSQKFTTEDVTYLLDKAYAKMKSEGIINEDSKCFVGKDEALAQGTSYAHFNPNMDPQMWCPVYLNTGLAAGKTYNIVGSSLKGLYAASPDEILKIITNRNEGYATAGDMCVENAQKRYDEFVQAWKDEYAKGDNKDSAKLKYYKEQQQKIRQMLNKTGGTYKTQNGQVVCLELPTVDGAPDTPPDTSGDNNGGTTSGGNNDSSSGVTGGTTSDLAECLNNASSLGWILCPVLNIVSKTVDSVYSDIEENWLPIDNNLISTTAGIYDAWKVFRDFANIVFVAMLIVIVLSQITGFGISNYGVKKILPSLIVVAVLVNMSFLFCQLAVDVVNVVGAEAGSIFARIGNSGKTSITGGTVVRGAIATIFSAAGVSAAAVGVTVAIVTNPGLLIPILIFGLGLIITLFFFYAILAIRKAGIYAMIILSPLAIVCYALPNTKSLFDKWKKLFTALLLVYPICQIVTGGGQMISGLMLKDGQDGFIYNVVAVILSFAPIFLIPSLIRNSLAGLGNIGTKLSQLGGRFRGATTSRLNNSDVAKRLRTSGAYLGATEGRNLVNKVNDKLRNAKGIGGLVRGIEDHGLGKIISRQNARKDAQAKAAYRKMLMDDAGAANISDTMTADTIANDLAAQEYKYRQDLISNTADGMLSGRGVYEDSTGIEQSINTNDLNSLSDAWEYYMNQYDTTGDDNALLNAQALTHLMIENNGDKGRTRVMNNMKARNFDAASGVSTRSASFNELSRYINRNSKWMAGLKAADTGSFRMIGDAAKGGAAGTSDNMANLHEYNTAAYDKLTSGNVRDLGDSFFDGVKVSNSQGVFDPRSANFDQARFNELVKVRDTFARTMADPRTAESIKPDMLREMNKINRIVYNSQLKLAFDKEYAAWQVANPGGSIKDFNSNYKTTHGGRAFGEVFGQYKDLTP